MTYTYDPTTDIGRVRRTLPDKTEATAMWTDEEIQSFLDDEGSSWRRATALVLETTATNELLVLKVIQIQNIQTDAAKMAETLLKRASTLRKQADEFDADSEDGDFDIIEFAHTQEQIRERLYNQELRGLI